jgi:isopentenyldiphosphate isomerase
MRIQQNDPGELLEVLDADGQPTGHARPRSAIHLDGDWHLAFHCWIVRDGGRQVVLQRRSLLKDTYAGCWDAAAAGHWRFGESAEDAAREIAEELGIAVPFARLEFRGREQAARTFANGLTDREFHDVYLLAWDAPLATYRPDPAEVSGVAAFLTADMLGGTDPLVAVEAVSVADDGSVTPTSLTVPRASLVPYSAERLLRTLGQREFPPR